MNIAKLRVVADNLRTSGKIDEALCLYDTVRDSIWGALSYIQTELTNFSTSLLSDTLRTTIQFKNTYSAQAANHVFTKWYNLDADQTYNEFLFTTYGRLQCYSQSIYHCATISADAIYSEYLVLQTLALYGNDWMNQVNKIATPVHEGERLKKLRINLMDVMIRKNLIDNAQRLTDTDWFGINVSLLDFLTNTGDNSSELYNGISKIIGPYAHKYRNHRKYGDTKSGHASGGDKKKEQAYEQYERYEKYERYERFEKRNYSQQQEFDYVKATEYEKAIYYGKILGLKGKVTKTIIKKQYYELISQYHPDKVDGLGEELRALAEKKTKEINAAYDWMKRKYDL